MGGLTQVRLHSADLPGFLSLISLQGIPLYRTSWESELSCCFWVPSQSLSRLQALASQKGQQITVLRQTGIPVLLAAVKTHILLCISCLMLITFTLWMPTRVLFLQVEGNQSVPAAAILAAAEEYGITFSCSRRDIRSEQLKNALLSRLPQLQWVGINTYGCTATISVRENHHVSVSEPADAYGDLYAACDGIIEKCTVRKGSGLCVPGQAVVSGQMLISGQTDTGTALIETPVDGEVYAYTQRSIHAVSPKFHQRIVNSRRTLGSVSIQIRKQRIFLWKNSSISPMECGRIEDEFPVTLPGGFSLPVSLYLNWNVLYTVVTEPVQESFLEDYCRDYMTQQMLAGTVLDGQLHTAVLSDTIHLTGTYDCYEMIGRFRQRQIGESHEQDN